MIETKLFEVRDEGTFIPVIASLLRAFWKETPAATSEFYLLRRTGYGALGRPNVLLAPLSGGRGAEYDPHAWASPRTMPTAHAFIRDNWETLTSGDVIDVEFILGEKGTKKQSERITA